METKSFEFCFFFSSGLVPLHNACSYGHYEVTELLLKVTQTHTNAELTAEILEMGPH